MFLVDLENNTPARIEFITGTEEIQNLLLSHCFEEGEEITVINRGPFNGPLLIYTCGKYLAIRKDLAKNIIVKPL